MEQLEDYFEEIINVPLPKKLFQNLEVCIYCKCPQEELKESEEEISPHLSPCEVCNGYNYNCSSYVPRSEQKF